MLPGSLPRSLGYYGCVATAGNAAELSSLATALDELTRRVTAIADRAGPSADAVTDELFQVERALREALRRLRRALDLLA